MLDTTPAPTSSVTKTRIPSAISQAAACILERGLQLSARVKEYNKDENHGFLTVEHMSKVAEETADLAKRYPRVFFQPHFHHAYYLTGIAHDIGRISLRLEQYQSDTAHQGAIQQHGERSIKEIAPMLELVDPEVRNLVKILIRFHDQKDTASQQDISNYLQSIGEQQEASLMNAGHALLRLFKDRDKIQILAKGSKYFEPTYMAEELLKWQFGGDNRKKCPWKNEDAVPQLGLQRFAGFPASDDAVQEKIPPEQLLREKVALIGVLPHVCILPSSPECKIPLEKVLAILGGNTFLTLQNIVAAIQGPEGIETTVNPLTMEEFQAKKIGSKPQVTYSWNSYIAYATQFVFGLELPESRKEAQTSGILTPWLDFLEKNLSESEWKIISATLADFFGTEPKA